MGVEELGAPKCVMDNFAVFLGKRGWVRVEILLNKNLDVVFKLF